MPASGEHRLLARRLMPSVVAQARYSVVEVVDVVVVVVLVPAPTGQRNRAEGARELAGIFDIVAVRVRGRGDRAREVTSTYAATRHTIETRYDEIGRLEAVRVGGGRGDPHLPVLVHCKNER